MTLAQIVSTAKLWRSSCFLSVGFFGILLTLSVYPLISYSQIQPIAAFGEHSVQDIDTIVQFHVLKKDNPSTGQIYLAPIHVVSNAPTSDMVIIDTNGNILFHKKPVSNYAVDFKLQPNGLYTYFDVGAGKFYGFRNQKYSTPTDSFQAVNGYVTDNHELRVFPDGGYVLIAVDAETEKVQDTALYGNATTMLEHNVIQEFTKNDSLIFEWNTKDHFKVTDATNEDVTRRASFIDYAHCNSIEVDGDTAYILSFRNMDEITKIDRRTGKIIWRFGGKNNQFLTVSDTAGFSHQHFVRRLPNGHITMFDNGNLRIGQLKPYSRALEFKLDDEGKIAWEEWEFRHTPDVWAEGAGSVQRLANGNTFIGWGSNLTLALSEVRPDGSTALEMAMTNGIGNPEYYSYRADWEPQAGNAVSTSQPAQHISLGQNYPNPTNGITNIPFSLTESENVMLALYDALGRQVKVLFHGFAPAGEYEAKCDPSGLPSGAYFYKLETPVQTLSKMLVFVR